MKDQSTNKTNSLTQKLAEIERQAEEILLGGGVQAIQRQHEKRRLTARERIDLLIDEGTANLELGLWSAYDMYQDWGGAPAAGVITTIGTIAGRRHMIIANDATVKAGAFFPATTKKVIRAQKVAMANRLPLVYLVDSAGVFLPLQEDVFPDEDDFGRIFRNNAVISASGLSQLAAIMGNCVAGGGYLPVLCDKLLMTEGSGLYLAGPALVKSAIGQDVSSEALGGAAMHAALSGTIDYREQDDPSCLARLKNLIGQSRPDPKEPSAPFYRVETIEPTRSPHDIESILPTHDRSEYEVRNIIACLVDRGTFQEYKAEYGQSIVCGTARLGGFSVGIVANQHRRVTNAAGHWQFGSVVYVDSAEKAARFVMNCNQDWLPLVFLQDVNGFMVGRDSEQAGIIKAGAKLVSAIANSRVPKLTVITGGSYGAGNYALCGKAFDPRFVFAWPTAEIAVMGATQATSTLVEITSRAMSRDNAEPDPTRLETLEQQVATDYQRQTDVRYAAARGWVDDIIAPEKTRDVLTYALEVVTRTVSNEPYRLGVFQV